MIWSTIRPDSGFSKTLLKLSSSSRSNRPSIKQSCSQIAALPPPKVMYPSFAETVQTPGGKPLDERGDCRCPLLCLIPPSISRGAWCRLARVSSMVNSKNLPDSPKKSLSHRAICIELLPLIPVR